MQNCGDKCLKLEMKKCLNDVRIEAYHCDRSFQFETMVTEVHNHFQPYF